ncbi:AraC family transcriptional regulator [Paenibacillus sp. SYP-B4298]|uniref:AraC family transcriptional regulator n=1 Tax=Paenibacillus sp. SYP-B4298 TaxID=2996034 RepID=UPI0022DDFBA3|nr:AraC family transcriptional regulator [Paenibacillus sp. SYP-B4298]
MIVVPELLHIWHYQAPPSRSHMPRTITEGRQDVELFIKGRGFFELEQQVLEVTEGSVLWHQSGDTTIYKTDVEQPYACIVVAFRDDGAPPVPRASQWLDRATYQEFIDQILTEYYSQSPDLHKLACYIYGQLYWNCQSPLGSLQQQNKRIREIQLLMDWIEQHFMEPIRLELLAELSGISLPHLHTVFKQHTGQSPYQYIQARRLKEAKILLVSTPLSVKEIATKSGFRDVGHFCRVFKQSVGVTAQSFRLQHMDIR